MKHLNFNLEKDGRTKGRWLEKRKAILLSVDFLQSCVTGAPYFPADHGEQKAHIFLQKLTGMGQHIQITRLPYENSLLESILAVRRVFVLNFLCVHTNVHKNNLVLKTEYRVDKNKT